MNATMKIATLLNDILSSKTPLAILLILTFLGSALAFSPAPAFAVVPACGSTITANTKLTGNMGPCPGDGLVIGASGITLNCAGHTIYGEGANAGISLAGITGVTVENCKVKYFYYGFELTSSSGDILTRNTANSNNYGFYLDTPSTTNTLRGNRATGNSEGFDLRSNSNTLTLNTATKNGEGFEFWGNAIILTRNTANSNSYGFMFPYSSGDSISGNKANGNFYEGFYFYYDSSNTLTGNTANSNKGAGFNFSRSSSNTLTGNTANKNTLSGFFLMGSSPGNALGGNTTKRNSQYGYDDLSTGSGTSGTANTYVGDHCRGNGWGGSNPFGLGTPQP